MASILIVDDDESFATALGRILKELGHESTWAVDGHEGLLAFQDGDYDLVIADLKMPRMNGVEFIREVKRLNADAVVLVVTGYADLASAVETLTLGAYDYIEKPVEVERFRAALERGLERRRLVAQLNFSKGLVWMIVLSIPLWMILGIILFYLWSR